MIKILHLLSNPTEVREQRSIVELSKLKDVVGYEYLQIINQPWSTDIEHVEREPGGRPFKLTKGHYGCWRAHRDAIMEHLVAGIDGLWIFECDAISTVEWDEFLRRMKRVEEACVKNNILIFTLGPKHGSKIVENIGDDIILITQFIETHAYYVPFNSKDVLLEMFSRPWDALDYCYTIYLYDQAHQRIGSFSDRPISVQCNGPSLIDGWEKTSEDHFKNLRY